MLPAPLRPGLDSSCRYVSNAVSFSLQDPCLETIESNTYLTYQMLILRPRPNRNSILLRDHPLKPRILHPPLQLRPGTRIFSKIPASLQQRRSPLGDRPLRLHGIIFRIERKLKIVELRVAAGFCEFEGLGNQFRPVGNRSGHVAGVDEVEFLGEGPGLFAVIDFEFYVCGHPDDAVFSFKVRKGQQRRRQTS